MTFKKYAVAAALLTAISAPAMAVDYANDTGTITFHGKVSGNTCKIALSGKIDQSGANGFDVMLDPVFVSDFGTAALGNTSTLGEQKFDLELTGCDTSIVKATAYMQSWGGSGASTAGFLVPQANLTGAAKNVNLLLSNNTATKTPIVLNQHSSDQVATVTNGAGTLKYAVAYTQGDNWANTTNPVTPGDVVGMVGFTISYQ